MNIFKFLIINIIVTPLNLFAIEATHLLHPGATFVTTASGRSCSTFTVTRDTLSCNPALFAHFKSSGIQFSMTGKAEGDSIETGKKLILEPITEAEIRNLFQKNPYNSFGFNSNISFFNPLFKLSYSPYFLLGDISIYNPAFPEITTNLLKRSTLSFSSGGDISEIFGNKDIEVNFGYVASFYSQIKSNNQFTLFDLASKKPDTLIPFQKSKGLTIDIGSLILFKELYELKISSQIKNIMSKEKIDVQFANSSTRLQNLYLLETYSLLGIGKSFKSSYGQIEFNIENFFSNYYTSYDFYRTSLGLNYSLGLFSVISSIGKYYQSTGLHFLSENFNVGLTFTRENNIGNYQYKKENSVYLGMDINL